MHGVTFPHRHPHEAVHLRPLIRRVHDLAVGPGARPAVVVHATTRPPARGAWNVQVFHGLGDKGYVLNPHFLQAGRWPRLRTGLNRPLAALRLPAPFLRPPARPGRRPGRYEQVNAYGPRFADALLDMLRDTEVSRFGHVALNDAGPIRVDPEGPLVWMPTWDNRLFFGGVNQSSLPSFAREVALLAREQRVIIKLHPHTVGRRQNLRVRRELQKARGVEFAPPTADPYRLLHGARGLLTDTSSLGFEAYCIGMPVALARPHGFTYSGLHRELAERTTVLASGRPDLRAWAAAPEKPSDRSWARDLLDVPASSRNDAFSAAIRQRAVEQASGAKW